MAYEARRFAKSMDMYHSISVWIKEIEYEMLSRIDFKHILRIESTETFNLLAFGSRLPNTKNSQQCDPLSRK